MDRTYWEKIAGSYEDEIFSVFAHDRTGRIRRALDQYAHEGGVVSDIGCGIGNFLPSLSERFRKVVAVDISAQCIAKARKAHRALSNVSYRTMDLSVPGVRLPRADVALSCNSILMPSIGPRERMFDIVCRHLRPRGHLILIVPSLESVFLTNSRLVEWNLRTGVLPAAAARTSFPKNGHMHNRRVHEGVVPIDGVDTKHYLEEELCILLKNRGMKIVDMQKIEYPWDTEFEAPPKWMNAPFPWDWFCVARKEGK